MRQKTEASEPIPRLWLAGAFLAFLFGPGITFTIAGEYRAAAIATIATLGIVMMVEAGFYEQMKASESVRESDGGDR